MSLVVCSLQLLYIWHIQQLAKHEYAGRCKGLLDHGDAPFALGALCQQAELLKARSIGKIG